MISNKKSPSITRHGQMQMSKETQMSLTHSHYFNVKMATFILVYLAVLATLQSRNHTRRNCQFVMQNKHKQLLLVQINTKIMQKVKCKNIMNIIALVIPLDYFFFIRSCFDTRCRNHNMFGNTDRIIAQLIQLSSAKIFPCTSAIFLKEKRFRFISFKIYVLEKMSKQLVRQKFHVLDDVFVKQKGYCPWPAQVRIIDKSAKLPYCVVFYGWHDAW